MTFGHLLRVISELKLKNCLLLESSMSCFWTGVKTAKLCAVEDQSYGAGEYLNSGSVAS